MENFDTQPLIEQLWQSGQSASTFRSSSLQPRNLLFLHYHPQSALVTNRLKDPGATVDVRDVLPLAKLDAGNAVSRV